MLCVCRPQELNSDPAWVFIPEHEHHSPIYFQNESRCAYFAQSWSGRHASWSIKHAFRVRCHASAPFLPARPPVEAQHSSFILRRILHRHYSRTFPMCVDNIRMTTFAVKFVAFFLPRWSNTLSGVLCTISELVLFNEASVDRLLAR